MSILNACLLTNLSEQTRLDPDKRQLASYLLVS